ncbi:GNAT family N-acetyltransferase [Candidatus Woesearchaeota archaeon]|nr:MAG: GNAT family N-acetyltransferase [Candidatus Woesearchaeota archaeon]
MGIKQKQVQPLGTKYYIEDNNVEVARVYLYILNNDLHNQPFALLEDLYVEPSYRKKGYGGRLVKKVIDEARKMNCYKLICTSRHRNVNVHRLYKKLGFYEQGLEFRIDL